MKYGALDSIPRQTTIGGQPHMLAYINPEEESLIQDYRGNIPPVAGPDGVPAYLFGFSWGGSSETSSSDDNDTDDSWSFTSIAEGIGNAISSGVTAASNFASDVGQAAVDTVVEIATLGSADTQTFNEDKYNLTYDATGGNTTPATTTTTTVPDVFYDINGVAHSSQAAADAANIAINAAGGSAYQEYADSMKEAGILSLGGKQTPDEPDNLGNTPILQYNGSDGSYEVVGGLDPNNPASLSTNEDGTLFVPYDGQDPFNSVVAQDFGHVYDQYGKRIDGDVGFQTDLPVNGAAILNEIGKNLLLETGDDSKMITVADGGGYQYVDGTQITDEVFETDVNQAIADGIIDPFVGGAGDEVVIGQPNDGADNFGSDDSYQKTREVRGMRDVMGDFIGGRSGGMWNRAPSYLTRFGYTPAGIDEMVRVVEQEDGTKLYYGADGALLNPELMEGVRLGGPTVSQKIGEENVLLGTQTLNPDGTVSDTAYTDLYDPEVDAGLFNYQ